MIHAPQTLRVSMGRLFAVLSLCIVSIGAATPLVNAQTLPDMASSNILITEIKLGGSNTTPSEYVSLYNRSNRAINVNGWRLQYAKASLSSPYCSGDWRAQTILSTVSEVTLTGEIAANSIKSPIEIAMTNATPGSVRLIDNDTIYDLVGWGSALQPASCFRGNQAPIPSDNMSLQRFLNCTATAPQNTDDNAADLTVIRKPSPGVLAGPLPAGCQAPVENQPDTTQTTTGEDCSGVRISELLPNPSGTDTGHEFIELHNPTPSDITLTGCTLQTSGSTTKTFKLDTLTLAGGAYLALYDNQTSLSLPNSAGGSVWLLSPSQTEIQEVTYPTDMDDDTTWTFVDGSWHTTYQATPSSANVLIAQAPCPANQVRSAETNRCVTQAADDSAVVPTTLAACPTGQTRNPETNRCRKDEATTPAGCPAGQSRNPETGRCRKDSVTSSTTPTTCKAGQERNPETSRCRNIAAAASVKSCPSGQERNPDTNRCRKIAVSAANAHTKISNVKDVKSDSGTLVRWSLAAFALSAALIYALYEWRQEIARFVNKKLAINRLIGNKRAGATS